MLMVEEPIPHGATHKGDPTGPTRSAQEGPEGRRDTRQIQGAETDDKGIIGGGLPGLRSAHFRDAMTPQAHCSRMNLASPACHVLAHRP